MGSCAQKGKKDALVDSIVQIPKDDSTKPNQQNLKAASNSQEKNNSKNSKRRDTNLTVLTTNEDDLPEILIVNRPIVRQQSFGKKAQGSLLTLKPLSFDELNKSDNEREFLKIEDDEVKREYLLRNHMWVVCKKGLKSSPNQDDFVVYTEESSVLCGVFDGHGLHGHDVSHFVHDAFPKELICSIAWEQNPTTAFFEAFESVHSSLINHCCESNVFDCALSGSTATLAYRKAEKLYVAHVGDSRAVMGRKSNGFIRAVDLTIDHKPNLPEECKRIDSMGGEVVRIKGDVNYRVFFKDKHYPGIAMSRALGDEIAQIVGVTYEPEVSEIDLDENDEFFLICSDGVWEFISSQEAVEVVKSFKGDAKAAAENLVALSWERWIENEVSVVDDITVILVYIN